MSRGPGRVERRIRAAFYAEPDRAFSADDLMRLVYGETAFTQSHRNIVCRAARKAAQRMPNSWQAKRLQQRGRPVIYYREKFANSSDNRETSSGASV
jgi:hypothetical protein